MKRLLSLLLAIVMVISMIPSAFAEAIEEPLTEATNPAEESITVIEETAASEVPADPVKPAEYAATSGNYTYTVSGGKATITDCNTSISGAVTIPSTLGGYPVTAIAGEAFKNCTKLTSVTVGNGVNSIGYYAFFNCTSLTSVTIGDSVTTIEEAAFSYCSSLTSITIPDSVTTIGYAAFYYCTGLTSITIPDSVTAIGSYAFSSCDSLTTVTIGNSVTTIGEWVFSSCKSLTSITIPDSVTTIGEDAFSHCSSLTSVTIPDGVTTIGDCAFEGCDSLTSVTIPGSVTSIGNDAFEDCTSLTSVTIGNGVTSIGENAFYNCESLTSVTIPDSVTTIGNCAFEYCSKLTSITIPGSVTSIGGSAFYSCTSLTSVTIPDSVTSIGDWAFSGCDSLTDVYYGGTEEQWTAISIADGNTPLTNATIYFSEHIHRLTATVTAPTCTAAGYTTYSCSGCDYSYTDDFVVALGHNYQDEHFDGNPGYTKFTCSGCGDFYTVEDVVQEPLEITNTAGNQHVIKNSSISFTVELNRTEGVTYQWQRCKNGSVWTNVSYTGNQTKTVTFDAASWAQYPFRCEITDANGTKIYTETYTYTLYEPPVVPNITSNPKDVYLLAGQTATFSVTAVGSSFVDDGSADTGVTYQWWRSRDGGNSWGEYTGAGGKTSSISLKVYSGQEFLYMCEVKDGYGNTLKSKVVQPHLITAVKITAQPTIAVENGTATIAFTATGDVKTYQWQRLKSNGWADAVGVSYVGYDTNTLTTTVKATYRCRIVDKAGNITYTNQVVFAG